MLQIILRLLIVFTARLLLHARILVALHIVYEIYTRFIYSCKACDIFTSVSSLL